MPIVKPRGTATAGVVRLIGECGAKTKRTPTDTWLARVERAQRQGASATG